MTGDKKCIALSICTNQTETKRSSLSIQLHDCFTRDHVSSPTIRMNATCTFEHKLQWHTCSLIRFINQQCNGESTLTHQLPKARTCTETKATNCRKYCVSFNVSRLRWPSAPPLPASFTDLLLRAKCVMKY